MSNSGADVDEAEDAEAVSAEEGLDRLPTEAEFDDEFDE